jgi:hypothetical protein
VGEAFGAPAQGCEAGDERLAPLVRLEVRRNGEDGAPVEVEVSLRVSARGEQLDAAPLRAPHLGRVERNRASCDEREDRLGFVRRALRQTALEILEQRALCAATARFG